MRGHVKVGIAGIPPAPKRYWEMYRGARLRLQPVAPSATQRLRRYLPSISAPSPETAEHSAELPRCDEPSAGRRPGREDIGFFAGELYPRAG
jgi:hypothetical protein